MIVCVCVCVCVCSCASRAGDSVHNHKNMTFIQREDFISDPRYNIHAAKLHFFCARAAEKSSNRTAKGARLWITSAAQVAWIVVWNNHGYSEQKQLSSGRHDLWTNRDAIMHFWELIALQLGRALLWSAAGSPLPYRFSCLDCSCGVRRSVQGCNGRRKDTWNQPGENVEDCELKVCRYSTATGCKDDADRHTQFGHRHPWSFFFFWS